MESEENIMLDIPKRRYNWCYAKAYALAISLGSFQFGKYSIIFSRIYAYYRRMVHRGKNTSFLQYYACFACPNWSFNWMLFCCILSKQFCNIKAERIGRRLFLIIANVIMLSSFCLAQVSKEGILACRVVSGIAVGIFAITVPLFCKFLKVNY